MTEKPRSAQSLVGRLSKNRKDQVLDRLVKRGPVRREEHLMRPSPAILSPLWIDVLLQSF